MLNSCRFSGRKAYTLASVVIAMMTGGVIKAAPVLITNPDFETDPAADPNGFNADKTGWGATFSGFGNRQSGTLDPGGLAGSPFVGENNFLQLHVEGNTGGAFDGVSFVDGSQTVTTIQSDSIYTLSVQVGSTSGTPFPGTVPANDTYVGFGGGPTILSRLVNNAAGTGLGETAGVTILSNTAAPVAPDTIATWTIVYQTNAAPANLGQPVSIQFFIQTNTPGGIQEALFDNVTLDVSPVPEPATAGIVAVGMLLAGCRRGRRRV